MPGITRRIRVLAQGLEALMVMKGWTRVALLVVVLFATSAATCHVHGGVHPGPEGSVTTADPSPLTAGVATVPFSLPAGTPLAGYGSTTRRELPPDLVPNNGYTFFKPNAGALDPLSAKALVMANGSVEVAIVTVDAVGIIGELVDRIHAKAVSLGAKIHRENLVVSASHTHSGPGSQTSLTFWELAGTDLLFPRLRDEFVNDCARALFNAENSMESATFGSASDMLAEVTVNRRVGVSPNVKPDTVDKELGVIRIDKADGTPLALLWNFAVHGTAYGDTNLQFSADIMGAVSARLETQLKIPVLFANGAEGDTAPNGSGAAGIARLSPIIADKIVTIYRSITTDPQITLQCASRVTGFGKAMLDLSLGRLTGGSGLNLAALATLAPALGHIVLKMDRKWFENDFRFQAIRMNDVLIVPVPGEPIFFVGQAMKADGRALGFNRVFIFGLSNGHMAYITDEKEYQIGGYEGIATFFGPHTADKVRAEALSQMMLVRP